VSEQVELGARVPNVRTRDDAAVAIDGLLKRSSRSGSRKRQGRKHRRPTAKQLGVLRALAAELGEPVPKVSSSKLAAELGYPVPRPRSKREASRKIQELELKHRRVIGLAPPEDAR